MKEKYIRVSDFLTVAQMTRASKLKYAKKICEDIIKPNIKEINEKIGQENDPLYLAYMVEYCISKAEQEK